MALIIPGGEPYFARGGPDGCLILHGFTASPQEVRPLAEHLARQDYTVLAPRLPGHATSMADLNRASSRDWQAAVEDSYHLLRRQCSRIVVMGLSTGGALALRAAAQFPVAGVVGMSTLIDMPTQGARYAGLVGRLIPYFRKGQSYWMDPARAAGRIAYPAFPVLASGQLYRLLRELEPLLPQVVAPVLLIHSRSDPFILPENMARIHSQLGTSDKTMVWLERSGHIITQDGEREIAFAHVDAFLKRILAP